MAGNPRASAPPCHVVFFASAGPSAVGHGGNHRDYQIYHELRQLLGEERVTLFDYRTEVGALAQARPLEAFLAEARSAGAPAWKSRLAGLRLQLRHYRRIWRGAMAEWLRIFTLLLGGPRPGAPLPGNRALGRYDYSPVFERYFELVRRLPRPLVCLAGHSNFARLDPANRRLGIATLVCPPNLESFDIGATELGGHPRPFYLTALNFGDELRALAACDARLCISRVEAGVVSGLGLAAHYYPYRPVGEVRQGLLEIRQRRGRQPTRSGLFLMVGSADHPTTAHSFRRFLGEAATGDLPGGARLVVCGRQTDRLALPPVVGVELRGWVEQPELDGLLAAASGVLLPQIIGFGALTRLAELACAGVPVIVSEHAAHAVQPLPPGCRVVGESWEEWRGAMADLLADEETGSSEMAYADWESRQPNPLREVLEAVCRDPNPPAPGEAVDRHG